MIQIALVGIGKIATDQHVPALAASADFDLAATVSRSGSVDGIEAFSDLDHLLATRPDIRVVSLCMPPVPRFDYAKKALLAGRHVMLEKPPGATLSECHELESLARSTRLSLYASWHSREAQMVAPATAWLANRTITRAHITWREDVRKWHPGQDWVFAPGGMGVFDPGINALSILTAILPKPVHLLGANLEYPENRQTPIAAQLQFTDTVSADFDWRQEGPQTWNIEVETTDGVLVLSDGGAHMSIDGDAVSAGSDDTLSGEYPRLYANMARLLRNGGIDMDLSPMRHVADAFTLGARMTVAPFHF